MSYRMMKHYSESCDENVSEKKNMIANGPHIWFRHTSS